MLKNRSFPFFFLQFKFVWLSNDNDPNDAYGHTTLNTSDLVHHFYRPTIEEELEVVQPVCLMKDRKLSWMM